MRCARHTSLPASFVLMLMSCGGSEPPDDPLVDSPGKIVFQSGGASRDLYLVNGSDVTRLTDYGGTDGSPSWSSDGQQIYFLTHNRGANDAWDLYAMDADGANVHPVLSGFPDGGYDVSPDGTRILTAGDDLFVRNIDGSGMTRLVEVPDYPGCTGGGVDCSAVGGVDWAPDGQRIAYSTYTWGRGGSQASWIHTVSADGTAHQTLTEYGRSISPAWSPDGQRIAFASGDSYLQGPVDLATMNADGTARLVLVDGHVDETVNTGPSWSPDGESIVFARYPRLEPEKSELFVVNADGTGLRRIATVQGGAHDPEWSPAAP